MFDAIPFKHIRNCLALVGTVVLIAVPVLVDPGVLTAHVIHQDGQRVFDRPEFRDDRFIPDVILVPENKGWLISILLPYFSPGANWLKLPDIFVVPSKRSTVCDRFLVLFKQRRVLSFVHPDRILKEYGIRFPRLHYISISDYPLKASLQLADAFAEKIPQVVVTSMKDPERFMRAAVFAGLNGLPLIPFRQILKQTELKRFVRQEKVQKVFMVTDQASEAEMFDIGFPVEPLSVKQAHNQTIRKIGREHVRNLIATRPMITNLRPRLLDDDMMHFVPYISLLRNALVVLLDSADGRLNEKKLTEFISRFHIQPKTVTVIGDSRLINLIELEPSLQEQVYNHKHPLYRELLSRPEGEDAFPYGVGRLPFSRLP